jgi:5-methylcytosine-specific restriction endonuclease McrA
MKPKGIPKRPNYRPRIKKGGNPFTVNKKQPPKELYGDNWEALSAYVRQRDNYTCQMHVLRPDIRCGIRLPPPFSNLLHAHHIVPLPKGSNHPTNLISLCRDCHSKIHGGKNLGKAITEKQKRAAARG